jgi:hypothetical protein
MRCIAIGLIKPHWHSIPIDGQARSVTALVTYEPVPEWFASIASDDFGREEIGEHADAVGAYCLATRYEFSTSIQTQSDPEKPSPHGIARAALETASMMLWLARRSSFGFNKIVVAEEDIEGWTWREVSSYDEKLSLPSYQSTDIEPEDFAVSTKYATAFERAKIDGTIRVASHSLGMALRQSNWPLRYLALWLVLEGLFGPSDARETTFRLCQRIALFLAPRGQRAIDLFKTVNESYKWRSKVVHGMRLRKLQPKQSLELIEELEAIVHRSLQKVIGDERLLDIFDSDEKDEYLDKLALIENDA